MILLPPLGSLSADHLRALAEARGIAARQP